MAIQGLRTPLLANNKGSLEVWEKRYATAEKAVLFFGLILPVLLFVTFFVGAIPTADHTGFYVMAGLSIASLLGLVLSVLITKHCKKKIEELETRAQERRLELPIEAPKALEPKKDEPISISQKTKYWPRRVFFKGNGHVYVVTNPDNREEQYYGEKDPVNKTIIWKSREEFYKTPNNS